MQTQYAYEPYGKMTQSGVTSSNAFQYTGRENDNTGLAYYRARYYALGEGRFIAEDPIGLAGGVNVYGYVDGNPLSSIDPLGLDPWWADRVLNHPSAPPGVDLNENIRTASNMSWFDFYNAVKPHGIWDYKRHGKKNEYEDFGNYNYGATCLACGFPESICKRAPGLFQEGKPPKSWSKPWGDFPYGDDPNDQSQIQNGIDYYRNIYR